MTEGRVVYWTSIHFDGELIDVSIEKAPRWRVRGWTLAGEPVQLPASVRSRLMKRCDP